MMSTDFVLRFGVGTPESRRSSVWRIWSKHSDVYLAPRNLAKTIKISFHKSGSWAFSFIDQVIQRLIQQNFWNRDSRHIDIWERTDNIASGITLAYRIVFPESELRVFPLDLSDQKTVNWITPPQSEQMVEVTIFFSRPGRQISGWPGKVKMNTLLLGNHSLPNGDILWVVYRYQEVTNGIRVALNAGRTRIDAGKPEMGDMDLSKISSSNRLLINGNEPDGSRYSIEFAGDTLLQ